MWRINDDALINQGVEWFGDGGFDFWVAGWGDEFEFFWLYAY
jgi:hypothetical protein